MKINPTWSRRLVQLAAGQFLTGRTDDKEDVDVGANDSVGAAAGQVPDADEILADEGEPALVKHLQRERNPRLRKQALAVLRKKGPVVCQACTFSFDSFYGEEIGKGVGVVFHHKVPLAQGARRSTVSDLVALCPNCHWAIHTKRPEPFTVDQLKARLNKKR